MTVLLGAGMLGICDRIQPEGILSSCQSTARRLAKRSNVTCQARDGQEMGEWSRYRDAVDEVWGAVASEQSRL